MSVVFKCDRCGEIFNRKVPDINDCYGTANSILFLDCTVERNRFGLGEEPIQLCPSCMKELNDWLEPNKEKLDNGNKNEWNNMTTQPQSGIAVEIKFMNKWISVKDELPEMTEEVTEVDGDREYTLWYESKPVLVFDKTIYDENSSMQTAVLTDDGGWLTTFDEKRLENVTYWMPLPEPPKEV